MTMQTLFDRAVGGVIAQGGPSREGKLCRYRSANESKCAVGHLIDDAHYDPDFENHSLCNTAVKTAVSRSNPGQDIDFITLQQLQSAHDEAAQTNNFMPEFVARARLVAHLFKLDWNFS